MDHSVKSLLFDRLAEVEVKVKEELRKTEAELDRELDQTTNAVDQQINLQKQLVWAYLIIQTVRSISFSGYSN